MNCAAALSRGSSVAPTYIPGDSCIGPACSDSASNACTATADTAARQASRSRPYNPSSASTPAPHRFGTAWEVRHCTAYLINRCRLCRK